MPRELWLLGASVSGSFSPAMQNAAFEAAGIEARYLSRDVAADELAGTLAEMRRRPEIIGGNVTIPHKQAVLPLLDELDPLAERLGAVNTIVRRTDRLLGANTDVTGFRLALAEGGYAVDGEPVLILGAGGAARAVAEALRGRVAKLTVVARNPARADRLIGELQLEGATSASLDGMAAVLDEAAVVVNATPADLPAPTWQPRAGQRVFDIRSRRSVEGRAMLLHQGAASFEIWTGRPAPLEAMRQALTQAIEVVRA
jgi:shikimate dehydrogenase